MKKRLFYAFSSFLLALLISALAVFTVSAENISTFTSAESEVSSDDGTTTSEESSLSEEDEQKRKEEEEQKRKEEEEKNKQDIIDGVISGIEGNLDSKGNESIPEDNINVQDTVQVNLDWATSMLTLVGGTLQIFAKEDNPYSMNLQGFIDDYTPYFKSFGYLMVVLLFGLNLINSAVQLELTDIKGVLKILGGLLLAKIWIDLSTDICIAIIKFISDVSMQLFIDGAINSIFATTENFKQSDTGLWIVGEILNVILNIISIIPVILVGLVVAVICGCVIVKIVMRSFEITIMTVISPVFFACLLGDATKPYFRNFLSEFLSSVCSLAWMTLIYVGGVAWINQINMQKVNAEDITDIITWFSACGVKVLIVVAMCMLMLKPPAPFRRLTGGN